MAGLATSERVRSALGAVRNDLRPRVITGGANVTPLLLLGLLNVVDGFDANAFGVLLPEIRDYFGVSLGFMTVIGTLTGVFGIVFALPVGYLADRVNRVWMTAIGAVIWGVMAVFTGFAWSFLSLAAFRLGAGLGKVLNPSQQALLADYYPPDVRPGVFSFHQLANRVGNFIGPLAAGALASLFFWQVPFLIVGLPSLVVAVLIVVKLKEPVRGEQERRVLGADEAVAKTGEVPPSWSESWRIARSVRTLRRFWFALPFLSGSSLVIGLIMPLYYQQVFGLGPGGRGLIQAFDEPVAAVGLIVGAIVSNRLLRFRPGRVITYVGLMSVLTGLSFALVALAPVLWLAVGFSYVRAFFGAILVPASAALITMVIPPRARGFALSAGILFALPGYLFYLAFGLVGDAWGLRAGLLVMTPVYLIGSFIIASAGSSVDADMRAAQAAALASHVSRESRKEGDAQLLVIRDLDVHYDQVQVLFNVDFEVRAGETIALLGTNGAGKSTLLRAIGGVTAPSNGAIFYDGEDITHLPPHEHVERGIVTVPGGKGVFPGLTVGENLRIAAWAQSDDAEHLRNAHAEVFGYFPVLRERLNEHAGNLSGGEQQMLTLAQAFLARPRLLMIDELSLGLAPAIVEQLLEIVRGIAARGTTIILVEQSVNIALTIAERAAFMEKGEIKFTGPTQELLRRPDILRSVYLKGTSTGRGRIAVRTYEHADDAGTSEAALDVRDVSVSFGGVRAVNGVTFALKDGASLGVIGPNGAGKTTLFDIISGFVTPTTGELYLFGEEITGKSPDQRVTFGLLRSFQDARLFPALTVRENLTVALERHLDSRSAAAAALHLPNVRRSERKAAARVDRLVELFGLGSSRDKFVRELSTGQRRIVDIACVMAAEPRVLLLDEPSSGIAQKEAEELGPLLSRIRYETGCSMLIIEHDMPLIMAVSDELLALELGAVVTRGAPHDVLEHPQVVASYLGTSEDAINRSGATPV
jgi:ABC-type branched-subunit amino acid transport system ATPase component/predicted MFS family arabinose efflux permease